MKIATFAKPQTVIPHFKDMLKIKGVLIIILFNLTGLSAQTRNLVILFDTLDLGASESFHILKAKTVFDKKSQTILIDKDTLLSSIKMTGVTFGRIFSLKTANYTDSSELLIPLDDNGGYLRILDLNNLDTIRFDKWVVYSNCYRDSIFKTVQYYENTLSEYRALENGKLLRIEHKTITKKKRCNYPIPQYGTSFKMNNKLYVASIQTILTSDLIHLTHSINKDLSKKEYPGNTKIILKYTHTWTKKYSNSIVVRMKNEA